MGRRSNLASMTVADRITADEYLATDEERRFVELIEGEVVGEQPLWDHQQIVGDALFALQVWSRAAPARGRASLSIDVRMNDLNVYAPEVLWYSDGRVPAYKDKRPYPLPDLAIEVRSPTTWRYDVGVKKRVYEQRGLRELWLVDTVAEIVLVFRRSQVAEPTFDVALEHCGDQPLSSPLLPGFALELF